MKALAILTGLLFGLIIVPVIAQQGLKGDYYEGTRFERKVLTRIDPQLNFNWKKRSPDPGLPYSYYSIRWTGKLLAPASGEYRFYAKVDDGIRLWVGNKKVLDSWRLNDSESYTGSIELEAGHYYDLRVDYFNDILGGALELFWQRPDTRKTLLDRFRKPSDPITAQYFSQKVTPVTATPKPTKPIATTPVIAVSNPPKAVPKKPLPFIKAQPVATPSPKRAVVVDTLAAALAPARKPVPEPESELKPDTTFILRNVQFEQSSYVLLPASSAELDQLVAALKKNIQWRIDVVGHTDNVGDPRLNLALSENRAKVVCSYLTRRGVADERVTSKGYGGTRPIADNTTESERSKNRRVEITIR